MRPMIAAAAILLTGAASGPQRYQVDARIAFAGRTVGTPRLFVDDGAPGIVEVGGPHGYRFVATVSREGGSDYYRLRTQIARPDPNGGWRVVARPQRRFSLRHPLATGGEGGNVRYSLAVLGR